MGIWELKYGSFPYLNPSIPKFTILNLAPYNPYDEDGVQKSDLVFRSNNEVCIYVMHKA